MPKSRSAVRLTSDRRDDAGSSGGGGSSGSYGSCCLSSAGRGLHNAALEDQKHLFIVPEREVTKFTGEENLPPLSEES